MSEWKLREERKCMICIFRCVYISRCKFIEDCRDELGVVQLEMCASTSNMKEVGNHGAQVCL